WIQPWAPARKRARTTSERLPVRRPVGLLSHQKSPAQRCTSLLRLRATTRAQSLLWTVASQWAACSEPAKPMSPAGTTRHVATAVSRSPSHVRPTCAVYFDAEFGSCYE